jgi:hypothetical protein
MKNYLFASNPRRERYKSCVCDIKNLYTEHYIFERHRKKLLFTIRILYWKKLNFSPSFSMYNLNLLLIQYIVYKGD